MSHWYYKVSNDITTIPDCISYFEGEIANAKKEISLKGSTIERHASELPGYVEHRYGQLQEIEAILEFLNITYRKTRFTAFKKYTTAYAKELSSRDAEKYVDGDDEVIAIAMLINEIALVRNKYLGIHKGLDVKNWQISNVVKLRAAGLEDIKVE